MPPATKPSTVNVRQAVAVGILAGLIVVAVVLLLDRVQRERMWREVDDALASDPAKPQGKDSENERTRPDPARGGGSLDELIGGFRNGEPIRGVPGDGLDDGVVPPPPSDA